MFDYAADERACGTCLGDRLSTRNCSMSFPMSCTKPGGGLMLLNSAHESSTELLSLCVEMSLENNGQNYQ